MKRKLIRAMKKYFGDDQKRIDHAQSVLDYAEQILKTEIGDREIIIAAAILHDIGIHEAERKYGSNAGKYQETEGPPIAERILVKNGFPPNKLDKVLKIIAHHHTPGLINTINFKIINDADWLVNIREEIIQSDKNRIKNIIDRVFLTYTGRRLACREYLIAQN